MVSGNISLTANISGILPVANGGTNSSTTLTNGKLMISSVGQIIEGTSSTNPFFTSETIGDANFGFDLGVTSALNPTVKFDSGDYITYDRATNLFSFFIGSNVQATLDSSRLLLKTLLLTAPSNQLLIGGSSTYTITASPAADRTYTLPNAGANADFVMNQGASTINGVKTFASGLITQDLTVQAGGTVSEMDLVTTSGSGLISRNDALGTTLSDSGGNYLRVGAGTVYTLYTTIDNGSGIGTMKGLNVTDTSNQSVLGTTNTCTITTTLQRVGSIHFLMLVAMQT